VYHAKKTKNKKNSKDLIINEIVFIFIFSRGSVFFPHRDNKGTSKQIWHICSNT